MHPPTIDTDRLRDGARQAVATLELLANEDLLMLMCQLAGAST